ARLDFEVDDALNINHFLRAGPVAGHLLLRSGSEPRILMAFPAGNSGVGLWFEKHSGEARWTLDGAPQPTRTTDARGRARYRLSRGRDHQGSRALAAWGGALEHTGTARLPVEESAAARAERGPDDRRAHAGVGEGPPRRRGGLQAHARGHARGARERPHP